MKKQKTNLAKCVHMYSSLQEMEKQFAHDVATMGKVFTDLVDEHFNLKYPWDQAVLAAIMTNILAYVEVQAELDGDNMERAMKDFYEINLEDYRKQAEEKSKKVKK